MGKKRRHLRTEQLAELHDICDWKECGHTFEQHYRDNDDNWPCVKLMCPCRDFAIPGTVTELRVP